MRFETSGKFPARIRSVFAPADEGRTVHLARRLDAPDRSLRRAQLFVAVGFAFSLFAGTALSFLGTRRLLRRMNAIRATAAEIAEGDLSRRVPDGREHDELQDLVATLNDMLTRIKTLMTDVKNVTDDIAHELKTPLTRIRGTVEPLLLDPAATPAMRDTAGLVIEECDRLNRMIGTMLQIARLEAGRDRPTLEPVDVRDVAREAVELFETVAEDRDVRLVGEWPERPLPVSADRSALQRVCANLIDNALRATPAGGRVRVACEADGRRVRLVVEDTGTGIPPDDLPRIFERFHRGKNSRSGEGTGLGLCLVRAIVRAHDGDVTVESRMGEGTRFVVMLPEST
jgi:signal transduction histidine kinase